MSSTQGNKSAVKSAIENKLGTILVRGWILDGAGPARYGWASVHPCKQRYEGRTLRDVAGRLGVSRG